MSSSMFSAGTSVARRAALVLLAVALTLAFASVAAAQGNNNNLFNNRAVGGVMIDPSGALSNATPVQLTDLQRALAEISDRAGDGLDRAVPIRRISLKGIEATIRDCRRTGSELPDAVLYLGGMQRIEYVVVYPDENDIVLAGPGEGWKVDDHGAVVGETTGRAVILLDDLLAAIRSAAAPQKSVMSCSIDPTPEGIQRLRAFTSRLRTIGNPRQTAQGIEEQLGPQKISVTGVPETSHFARVMVAADYRMKRVSMKLEPSPVEGLPSFMDIMKASGKGMQNMLPRWWLAPDYQPLLKDPDGLTWQIRGASVKAMAENDFLDAAGITHQTGRADAMSQRWADLMTEKYDELSQADPIFAELRNCMDVAVVGALLVKQDLIRKAGAELPLLLGTEPGMALAELNAPKNVESKSALVRNARARNWTIAAGGVQINPWAIVDNHEESASLSGVRTKTAVEGDAWWAD